MKDIQKKIAIVEDNLIFGVVLQHYLAGEGFQVQLFRNGLDALQCLRRNPVDVLITDLEMPLLNGWEIIEQVRVTMKSDVPIIVMSSLDTNDLDKCLISAGANFFLAKPFSISELKECMKKL